MASPIIHRICKPDKNSLVNSNVTEHPYSLEAQCFSLAFSLIPPSRSEPVDQEDRFRIKKRETNFPHMPIQMTYKYAEMPMIGKHHRYILVLMDPVSMRICGSSDAESFETLAKIF
jgi:hypothetical protein